MKHPVYDPEWSPEQKAVYEHDMQEIWDPNLARQIWNLYHNQLDIYIKLAGDPPQDILDVGCAQGTLALKLAEKGHRVTAVDIRQSFLDYAVSRYTHGDIEFICGNAFEVEIDKKYDVVFANQIMEHLVYPVEFASNLKKLLKPGGLLVMTTPNGQYVKNGLPTFTELGDPKKWEHKQFTADGDEHFFAYTISELDEVVKSAGLRDVQTTWFESPWMSGHMKFRYLHKILPTFVLRVLDRICVKLPIVGKKITHQLQVTGRRES